MCYPFFLNILVILFQTKIINVLKDGTLAYKKLLYMYISKAFI